MTSSALATAVVAIVHGEKAYTFTRQESPDGNLSYGAKIEQVDALNALRPGSLFETGSRWQMVPSRLYRFEDRADYLRGLHPYVSEETVGVLSLPELEAMAVFDRNQRISANLYSGNHIAELFIEASTRISIDHPTHLQVFFFQEMFWITLVREGQLVVTQALRYASETDCVFYLAAYLQHFGVQRDECPVIAGGYVMPGGSLYRELEIFFRVTPLEKAIVSKVQTIPLQLLLAYQDCLREAPLQIQ